MSIHKLILTNFKSYKGVTIIGPFDRFSSIIGPNGSGKSNIVDALSFAFLLPTSHLRANNLEELVNDESEYASVEVQFKTDQKSGINQQSINTTNLNNNTNLDNNINIDINTTNLDNKNQDNQNLEIASSDIKRVFSIKRLIKNKSSVFYLNEQKVSYEEYYNFLENNNIFPKAKNFIIFQGEIESIANKQEKELVKMIEEISGSIKYKKEYESKKEELNKLIFELQILQERKKEKSNKIKNINESKKVYKNFSKNLKRKEKLSKKIKERKNKEKKKRILEENKKIKEIENEREKVKERIKMIENEMGNEMFEIQKKIYVKENEIRKIGEEMKREVNNDIRVDDISDLDGVLKEYEEGMLAVKRKYLSKDAEFYIDEGIKKEYERLNSIYKQRKASSRVSSRVSSKVSGKVSRMTAVYESDANSTARRIKELEKIVEQNERMIEMMSSKVKNSNYEDFSKEENILNSKLNKIMIEIFSIKQSEKENEYKIKLKNNVELLKSKFNGVYGILIDLIKPLQKKYEIALSVLFKGYENALLVDSQNTSIECIKYMKEKKIERLIFIPLNEISLKKGVSDRGGKGVLAVDAIEYDKKYEKGIRYVLQDTVIIENDSRSDLSVSCVSLSGTFYNKNGSITAGKVKSKFDAKNLVELIKVKNEIVNKLKDLNLKKNCFSHFEILNEKIKSLKNENIEKVKQIKMHKEELHKSQAHKSNMHEEELHKSGVHESDVHKDVLHKSGMHKDDVHGIEFSGDDLEKEVFSGFVYANRLSEFRDFIENGEFYVKKKEIEYETMKNKIEHLKNNKNLFNAKNSKSEEFLNSKFEELNELKKLLSNKKLKNEMHENEMQKELEKLKKLNTQKNECENEKFKLEHSNEGSTGEIEGGFDNTLDEDSTISSLSSCAESNLEEEYEKVCLELQNMPVKIGNENNLLKEFEKINFEYEEKRKIVINQKNDFENVKKLRIESFNECFNKIQASISQIYKSLVKYEGSEGNAYLLLENNSEPYNDGLKYFVMPPKKRYMELSVLSGGEKTIAALALLLSFHSHKPSRFYVFDELDSALDKINVKKIVNFILNSNLQFIAISLKPEFFENSDSLIGVYKKDKESKILTLKM